MYSVEERIQYLQEQIKYYRSVGNWQAFSIYTAICNELMFWVQQGEMKAIYDYNGGKITN